MEKITTNLTITLLIVVVFCSTILTYTIYTMDDYRIDYFVKEQKTPVGKVSVQINNPEFNPPDYTQNSDSKISIKINPSEE